ncbi:MAG: hypothetical protein SX243_24530 [Acidobacteriota bacterium]|nr:hypothetical protein [Acidobacteriota bacterium]
MNRKLIVFGLALVFLIAPALVASATTANFEGWCSSSFPNNCVFDTRRPTASPTSCGSSSIDEFFWDYGDNTYPPQFETTTSPIGSHTYPPGMNTVDVCVTVFCVDGTSDTKCHCFGNVIGYSWCIRPVGSWTP